MNINSTTIIRIIVAALLVALLVTIVQGCKSLPPVVAESVHTSDKKDIELRVDTFWRDRWHTEYRNGDTVIIRDSFFIYVPRWRDREVIVTKTDSVPYPVEVPVEVPAERTGWDKFCTKWFIGSALLLLVLLLWRVADHIPALKGIKTIIKTFIKL